MPRLKFNQDTSALVIVAHPDDETIWMGGMIMKYPEVRWTIFSLCRASDPDRAPKFRRVCQRYGAKSIITDLEDEGKLSVEQTIPIIKKLIINKVGQQEFDCIFTHGANGEYRHPRHIGVHRAVKSLVNCAKLKTKTILYFNYQPISQKDFSLLKASPDSDYTLKLTKAELLKKRKIVADMYGYAPDGIDVGYCTNPEAFKITKIADNR